MRVVVTDASTGATVPGATVRIATAAAITGGDGTCTFSDVPEGRTRLAVTKPGYATSWLEPEIASGETTTSAASLARLTADATYDVVVVGAGTGGVSAALQASRMGTRVALLEDSDWIGGQMTAAAVTSMDEGPTIPSLRSGLYGEFIQKVLAYYSARHKSTGTAYFTPWSVAFEPGVGQAVIYGLLRNSDQRVTAGGPAVLDVFLGTDVTEVLKEGNAVRGVRVTDGSVFRAASVIDATEYGDLLPLAGARYRLGSSTSDALNLAACTQDITYTAVIHHFPNGAADLLTVASPPGYADVVATFRRWVTNDGNFSTTPPVNFVFHNAYRGMPDSETPWDADASRERQQLISKTGVNWFNDVHVTADYVENRAHRREVDCAAKLKTLQFLFYLQHDLAHSDWSVAVREGFDTPWNETANACPSFPPELREVERELPLKPYIREGRRAIGMATLIASDIRRQGTPPIAARRFPSALAVGDYPVDLHGCKQTTDLDCGETTADIPPWGGGLFQVPFEVFVPEVVDGLVLAEKNISVSRLVNGAIRLQPITMMTGQAAGALAAISARDGVPPRAISPVRVQSELLDSGCVLSLQNPADVPGGHPLWKRVQLALVHGIVAYDGDRLDVDGTIAYAEMSAVLGRAFGTPPAVAEPAATVTNGALAIALAAAMQLDLSTVTSEPVYADVPPSDPAFAAVQRLHELGVLDTPPGSLFEPDGWTSRGRLVSLTVGGALLVPTSALYVAR